MYRREYVVSRVHGLREDWFRYAEESSRSRALCATMVVRVRAILSDRGREHNVCKTVWLSEALLVYGEMTWTLLTDSLDELRKCLKSAFSVVDSTKSVTLGYDAN
jgi:hypothetical protein